MPFLFCLPGPAAQRAQDGSPIRRAKNARRRAAPPSPRLPRRRCAHRSRRARCARRRPAAGRQSARRMAATPRPSPPQNTPVGRAPRPIAPPAAPPQKIRPAAPKFGPTARPRHAAGDRRPPKRAVWQPHRAPPRHENSPVSRTPHAAPPSPRRPRRREKSGRPRLNSGQPHGRAMPQATAGRQSARRMAATPRPSLPQKYSCWPRAATHRPAGRAAAKSPAKHPTGCTPSQSTRPRPYGRGRVSRLSVSFLPLKMAAAHNRKGKRRTIAGAAARPHVKRRAGARTTAHDRMNRGSWQATRKRMNRGM